MNNSQYPNVFSKFKKLPAIVSTAKLTMLIIITSFFKLCSDKQQKL